MKYCKRCKEEKSESEFYKKSASKEGLQPLCKECRQALDRERPDNPVSVTVKICRTCNLSKPAESFYKDPGVKDGLFSYCKLCTKLRDRLRPNNPVSVSSKLCFTCKALYPATSFNPSPRNKDGLQSSCKLCNRRRQFNRRLDEKYSLTLEQFDEMMLNQGGMCAICDQEAFLVVDHDHETGKVRQLLCKHCNTAIGFLRDSIDVATKATDYLKKHSMQ